jgi:ornithine cyclodeaminase
MTDDVDHVHMARAVELARRGAASAKPNPAVGCVIVNHGRVVGEGFTQRAGGNHAEIEALNRAGSDASGATVYVSLEPCAHTGRTGPCAAALIAAGVARVVFAGPGVEVMAMIGAGAMARPLIEAHLVARPSLQKILIWNRTRASAGALAASLGDLGRDVRIADELSDAVRAADLICSATFAVEPLIKGEWLKPGAHVDLVGAFRPDMREADDETLMRGRLFVDARATTIHHIGELMIPLKNGVIAETDIEGDFFDLCSHTSIDRQPADITVFKNGGGAHLDLITAKLVYERVLSR